MSRPIAAPGPRTSRESEPTTEIPWIVRIANLGSDPSRPAIMPWKLGQNRSRPPTVGSVGDGLDTLTVRRDGWVFLKRPLSRGAADGALRGPCKLVPWHPYTREVFFTGPELADFFENVGLPIWEDGTPQGGTNPVEELTYVDHQFQSVMSVDDLRCEPPSDDVVSIVEALNRDVGEIYEALLYEVLSQKSGRNEKRLAACRTLSPLLAAAYPRDYVSGVLSSPSANTRPFPNVVDTGRIAWMHGGSFPQVLVAELLNFGTLPEFETFRSRLEVCGYCGRFFLRRRANHEYCTLECRIAFGRLSQAEDLERKRQRRAVARTQALIRRVRSWLEEQGGLSTRQKAEARHDLIAAIRAGEVTSVRQFRDYLVPF